MDRDPAHMRYVLKAAALHKGVAFVEVLQNCIIYNDGTFSLYTEKETKPQHSLFLEEGKPLLFANGKKVITLNNMEPSIQELTDSNLPPNAFIHNPSSKIKSSIIINVIDDLSNTGAFPKPFGILYKVEKPTYQETEELKKAELMKKSPPISVISLIKKGITWQSENNV